MGLTAVAADCKHHQKVTASYSTKYKKHTTEKQLQSEMLAKARKEESSYQEIIILIS